MIARRLRRNCSRARTVVGDELEQLGEAAADLALDGDRVEHELEVFRPNAPAELGECVLERPAQVNLGHDPPELPAGRLADIGGDRLQAVVEPVARPERRRERVEDLGQLLLECPRPPERLDVQDDPRRREPGRAAGERQHRSLPVEQERERYEADQHVEADERPGAGVDAGAIDVELNRLVRPEPGEQLLGTGAEPLHDHAGPRRALELGLREIGAELTANLLAPARHERELHRTEDEPRNEDRDDDELDAHETRRPPAATSRGSLGSKTSTGSTTPDAASLSAKWGRIPVGRAGPLPGFARNRSWIVITSDSIRRTSVTWVTTLVPSTTVRSG